MCSGPPRYYNLCSIVKLGVFWTFPLPERPGFSLASAGDPGPSELGLVKEYSILAMPWDSPGSAQVTPRLYDDPYSIGGLCELPNSATAGASRSLRKEVPLMRLFESQREASTEVPASRGKAPLVSTHHMIEESAQEATIEAFLVAHEGHISEVEAQRGTWSIYCRCERCDDIHTYEVDNEAR
jgi:hypothetical protein